MDFLEGKDEEGDPLFYLRKTSASAAEMPMAVWPAAEIAAEKLFCSKDQRRP